MKHRHMVIYARLKEIVVAAVLFALTGGLAAHDEGHTTPDRLPPLGPHGGKYAKLERHFAEVVVRDGLLTLYILEPDVKYVAEDASGVTAEYEIPGKSPRRTIKLTKQGDGYVAKIIVPRTARRVVFYVSCTLDGKRETGSVLYEPKPQRRGSFRSG